MLQRWFFRLCFLFSTYFSNKCLITNVLGYSKGRIVANAGQNIVLPCSLSESDSSRKWFHNSRFLFLARVSLMNDTSKMLASSNNYSLIIKEASVSDEGVYVCKNDFAALTEYYVEIRVAAKEFFMKLNDRSLSDGDKVILKTMDTISASCHVRGARPANNLTWMINDKRIIPHFYGVSNSSDHGTFDSFSNISHILTNVNVTLSCIRKPTDAHKSHYISVTVAVDKLESTMEPDGEPDTDVVIPFIAIVCSCCIVVVAVVFVALYLKGLPVTHRNHSKSSNVFNNDVDNPDMLMSSSVNENETSDRKINEECIKRNDVVIQSKLPGNGIMTYWIATCPSSALLGNMPFVAKSVSEAAHVADLMEFRTLARQLLTLQKHDNIVEVFGISIDDVPYYIYLEYVGYGTLRNYMLRNYLKKRDTQIDEVNDHRDLSSDDEKLSLTTFSVNVVDGMAYLFENQFRHPVVKSSKVLMASSGKCKLYDFVPAELAKGRLLKTIEKKNAPLAWLPPETIFLRQYSEKSDVWSLAVTLWEIFSLGETPYGGMTEDEIEKHIRNEKYLSQPMSCPGAIFGMILSCWDKTPSSRPSFQRLQEQVRSVLNSIEHSATNLTTATENEEVSYFTLEETLNDNSYI